MHHGFKNSASFYGWLFETILIALIAYIPPLNTALGTRMIASAHFMVLSFPFFSIIFFYDEFRKYYIRRGIDKETSRSTGWFALNTFY
jgi:Cation transporting ATPase, C-terminus